MRRDKPYYLNALDPHGLRFRPVRRYGRFDVVVLALWLVAAALAVLA